MASPKDVIVKVNGRKITNEQFERLYRAMARQRPESSGRDQQEIMGQALNELVRQDVLSQEAKRYGIVVTDDELRSQLASIPAFQREGQFDPATYAQVVQRTFGMNLHDFEAGHKKDVSVRKLNLLVASGVQVSDAEVEFHKDAILEGEKDPKVRKEIAADSVKLRDRVREKQIQLVFADWLNRLNSDLKVSIVSDQFRQRLAGPSAPAGQPPAGPPQ